MQLVSDDAIILDVKESTFKGRDGQPVTFKQARVVDDQNEVHKVTVPQDFEFPSDYPWQSIRRLGCKVVIEVEDNNNKLRKRLVSIE